MFCYDEGRLSITDGYNLSIHKHHFQFTVQLKNDYSFDLTVTIFIHAVVLALMVSNKYQKYQKYQFHLFSIAAMPSDYQESNPESELNM